MKLVTFTSKNTNDLRLGAVIDSNILDLNLASNGVLPSSMLDFIVGGNENLNVANKLVKEKNSKFLIPLDQINIKAPLLNPPSLKDCFAFEEHAKAGAKRRNEELPKEWYEIPAYYKGNHREIYGPEDEIPWPYFTRKFDFECEIACVVGKKGKNLKENETKEYIFGYMIFNDLSARDIQKKEMTLRMGPAKGKDFGNVFGPYLLTADEVNPQEDFSLTVKVNGEIWSTGHFKDQFWGFPLVLSYLSQEETIYPGDIIGSGTFYKGCGLDLDRWIKPGDVIELEVPKLGILRNKIGFPINQRELDCKKMEKFYR